MATAQHEYSGVDRDAESERLDGAELEKAPLPEPEWKPGRGEYAVMLTLAVISLMVSLDATILVPALPVSDARHTYAPSQL
jgi:ABC-type cobalt transport system substrate-binding protein